MSPLRDHTNARILGALRRAATRQIQRREFHRQTGPSDLERSVREYCGDTRIVIASKSEPYQHVRRGDAVEVIRSPGGLASALDSVARATGAVWVAQAQGDADRESADIEGRVRMPPGVERYTLQRLWIEPEDRAEGFNRFANGCLWPLCHVVYVRPHFEPEQWRAYRDVNQQYADAILGSIGTEPALVLLQDYHLALCAARLRARRPDLTIVLFWHIPWPNPEVFRILPWKQEVLEGLLACDLLGFHIGLHAMNFLDTVALELEAHIDRERSAVRRRGHRTFVRPYPISPDVAEISLAASDPWTLREAQRIRESLGLGDARVILGVDRLDYTKGVPERLDAYARFLDAHPEERDRVVMIQIGVPSRVDLPEYQALGRAVDERVASINERFGGDGRKAVHLITGSLDFKELIPYYVLADVMAVTSLHDGMNLVAKEYVAAKPSADGALVLSPYTGASRELEHAIQVSPYDTDLLAAALHRALHLSKDDRASRMRALREVVASQNIYDWARKLIRDVRRLHLLPGARPSARR
jgi:trehalose 6-phosphate synthase